VGVFDLLFGDSTKTNTSGTGTFGTGSTQAGDTWKNSNSTTTGTQNNTSTSGTATQSTSGSTLNQNVSTKSNQTTTSSGKFLDDATLKTLQDLIPGLSGNLAGAVGSSTAGASKGQINDVVSSLITRANAGSKEISDAADAQKAEAISNFDSTVMPEVSNVAGMTGSRDNSAYLKVFADARGGLSKSLDTIGTNAVLQGRNMITDELTRAITGAGTSAGIDLSQIGTAGAALGGVTGTLKGATADTTTNTAMEGSQYTAAAQTQNTLGVSNTGSTSNTATTQNTSTVDHIQDLINNVSQGWNQNWGSSDTASRQALIGQIAGIIGAVGASDRRLKENIKPIGKLENGLTLYSYNLRATGEFAIGLMADEVREVHPDAVTTAEDGFDRVNYMMAILPVPEKAVVEEE
jgi:hypothetical protein